MRIELCADRFLRLSHGHYVDLACGRGVTIRRSHVRHASEEMVRAERCATLSVLRHPHLTTLVDYGPLGGDGWFEAYTGSPDRRPWRRRDFRTGAAVKAVVAFMHAQGVSAGELSWVRLREEGGVPVLDVDERTGRRWEPGERSQQVAEHRAAGRLAAACTSPGRKQLTGGVVLPARRATAEVIELLDAGRPGGWRQVYVRAPAGAGLVAWLDLVSREARLRGFVPVALSAFVTWPGLRTCLAERHLMLIDDLNEENGGQPALRAELVIHLGIANWRPNLIVTPCVDLGAASPVIESVAPGLDAFDAVPAAPGHGCAPASRHAGAYRSGGVRSTCVVGQVGTRRRRRRVCAVRRSGVREVVYPYDRSDQMPRRRLFDYNLAVGDREQGGLRSGDAPIRGLTRIVAQGVKGLALVRQGRHARAERLLRAAAGALARRGAAGYAGQAAMTLGRMLLDRGRVEAALEAFMQAHEGFAAAAWDRGIVEAATFTGLARTDAGHLVEGEAALRAARIAAEQCDDHKGELVGRLGLVRCLFWQGRYREARTWLDATPETRSYQQVIARRLASRLALTLGDLESAGVQAAAALELAAEIGRPVDRCGAHADMAAVQAGIGNVDGLRRHVAIGLDLAKCARAPLVAMRRREGARPTSTGATADGRHSRCG